MPSSNDMALSAPVPAAPTQLPYATPATPPRGPKVRAGALFLITGLGLVILAGCFLIGAICLIAPDFIDTNVRLVWTARTYLLLFTLYLLALAAVCGAVALFFLGSRTLLRIADA